MPPVSDADWGRDAPYLEGLELLIAGYPWEAHERLEAVWRSWPEGPLRRQAQALIHAAAADIHQQRGRAAAAVGQARKALARWASDEGSSHGWMGLCHRPSWRQALTSILAGESRVVWPLVPPPLAVVGAAAFRDGRLLAMRRSAHRTDGGLWEFPGGKVELGESEPDALRREVHEELGWTVDVGAHVSATGVDRPGGGMRLAIWAVRAPPTPPTLRDHDASRWLHRDEVAGLNWVAADVPLAQRVVAGWERLSAT